MRDILRESLTLTLKYLKSLYRFIKIICFHSSFQVDVRGAFRGVAEPDFFRARLVDGNCYASLSLRSCSLFLHNHTINNWNSHARENKVLKVFLLGMIHTYYSKIPIISPGLIFVQSFFAGLIFGGAYSFAMSFLLEGILRFKMRWA